MSHHISPPMAGLVANWANTLLYGITTVTYFLCMYVLIKRRGDRNPTATWILISISTVQFILSTIHVAVSLRSLIEGFIDTLNIQNGALLYWNNPSTKSALVAKTVYVTNALVGDLILIWRLYTVWRKNIYICLLPIVITCAAAVIGYISNSKLTAISGNVHSISVSPVLNLLLPMWCLLIATQVISTSLIVGKIWWYVRCDPVAKSRYVPVIAIIVESGAIYTLSTILLLALTDRKTYAGTILGHITTQIATIVPTLIIIRAELSRGKDMGILGRPDLTGRNESLNARPIVFRPTHQQDLDEDPSVQITLPAPSASGSLHDAKYAVSFTQEGYAS
ncbi:hypothetical protein D9619_011110 [Psilocybe cf. subviscida]|uniref:Uncharacterized protein n=1 Tax=Psilocybe cf. subviscida TaxID=2480587 RepID=A0A8H5F545_9AGAR|nr:hypothetical protein D9619_011110 [Psilocybe cf. subviscida]